MINLYEQVDDNKRKSIVIIAIFLTFIGLMSYVFSQVLGYGPGAVGFAMIIAGLMGFTSYWWSDKIILGISGARKADRSRDFNFYTVTQNLSSSIGLPMPELYVIEDTAPNAFATGRDPKHAVICATTGLLSKLDRTELEGVIAHELSHIKNYDIRLMGIVTILIGMIVLLGDWFIHGIGRNRDNRDNNVGTVFLIIGFVLALLSPVFAQLIQMSISRRREFLADASGVMITKYPNGLISALEKISQDKEPLEAANKATAHLYIINPFKEGLSGKIANMFNTHPPIEERIKALKGME